MSDICHGVSLFSSNKQIVPADSKKHLWAPRWEGSPCTWERMKDPKFIWLSEQKQHKTLTNEDVCDYIVDPKTKCW